MVRMAAYERSGPWLKSLADDLSSFCSDGEVLGRMLLVIKEEV